MLEDDDIQNDPEIDVFGQNVWNKQYILNRSNPIFDLKYRSTKVFL